MDILTSFVNDLRTIAAWAILLCGFACVVGMLFVAVLWCWSGALRRRKDWHALLLMTAKALNGTEYNRRLVMPALKEWIAGSDLAAYQAIEFIRKLHPNAETVWDENDDEEDRDDTELAKEQRRGR